MKKILIISIVFLLVSATGFMLKNKKADQETKNIINTMKITSPAFLHNQSIPGKYTCDGDNISPPLVFFDMPSATKSFALIMEDPDVPKTIRPDGMWDHWIVWDIDPHTHEIKEGLPAEALAKEGVMGKNSGGDKGYAGPCPPDREHRYFFKLYALDLISLALPDSISKAELEKAMEGHILAEAELIGLYQRQ